ncbi:hypothetical protein PENVUL_c053G04969, partial [Penicillium vulpinum]
SRSPPSPLDRALNQLVKGFRLTIQGTILLAKENKELRAANEKQKQKRTRSRRQIPTEEGLSVQEASALIMQQQEATEAPLPGPGIPRESAIQPHYKSANILLSGTGSDSITAKVGDLGLVVPAGELLNAQPYAMRAPEVFLGEACAGPSQVWAVAAMLLCWIKTGVLGMWDSPHPLLNMPWSMAKIKRLFPNWKIPTPDEVNGHFLKASLNIAVNLGKCVPELQAILPFDKETKTMEMPNQLRDLLRFMLVHDPGKRPSASSVLASRELRAFENLMGA